MGLDHSRTARDPADVLALGFGVAVAMWLFAYVCLMPGVHAPGWLLSAGLLIAVLSGGWLAGRRTQRGWRGGAWVGLVAGGLNLLILASLLGGDAPNEILHSKLWYIPGSIGATIAIAALAGTIGAAARKRRSTPQSGSAADTWRPAFVTVAIAATLALIVAGGLVTAFEAGLAVPDWPGSFGYYMFLYPLREMKEGVFFEHAHRLLGSLVGLTMLVLAIYLQFVEQNKAVRALAGGLLLAVIVQGVLGGLRVTERDLTLAILHGVLAQLFFAGLWVLHAAVSAPWRRAPAPAQVAAAATDRTLGAALLVLLMAQLILGALQRHVVWGLHLHITMAVVVASLAAAFGLRCWGLYDGHRPLSRLGASLAALVVVQLLLGIAALVATGAGVGVSTVPRAVEAPITTAHQTLGAVLLAIAAKLVAWHRKRVAPVAPERTPLLSEAPA